MQVDNNSEQNLELPGLPEDRHAQNVDDFSAQLPASAETVISY